MIAVISRATVNTGLRLFVAAALVVAQSAPAFAYLKFGVRVGTQQVTLKWAEVPIRYYIADNATVPGVSRDAFQTAVGQAFATWEAVPTASVAYRFSGITSARPGEDDGLSTLGFRNEPDLDRVLAATSFMVDDATGALIESDIFLNAAFPWSTATNGESGRFDVQSIALHEIGHFSGLGHSALGETEVRATGGRRVIAAEAVMFPIAYAAGSIAQRTLKADDIAGISDVYPDDDFPGEGSISGSVSKNGTPIFGAHVVAYDLANGSMVATFTLNTSGQFAIAGLSPGPHLVRVEPLDDADLDSFFDESRTVDISFQVTFFNRIVIVPRGADSGAIAIAVAPK